MPPEDPGAELVARAAALQPAVRAAADEAERERRLPSSIATAMAGAGLYRVAAPRSMQGAEASPRTQIRVIETIAEADGSTGWNLMIGIESFGLIGALFEHGADLLSDPKAIVSSATSATGAAERVQDGYRVTGRWPFVSGCHNADFFAGLVEVRQDGAAVPGPPVPTFAVVPRADLEILDTWHVAGLRGSGSHDVRLEGVFVPEENLTRPPPPGAPRAAITRVPLGVRLAYNKVGVAFGIARSAIDAFALLATGKVPRFSGASLRERSVAQRAAALAEVRLRGARALVLELVDEVWERARADAPMSDRERAIFVVACADAVAGCAEAVDRVAEAAGTTANRLDSPLERASRDVRVVRQHITVASHLIEDGGRVLLGLEPRSVILAALR